MAYLLAEPATLKREFGNLERIPDQHPKLVLSLDPLPPPRRDGVQYQNLMTWLLDEQA